jgi:hypothetical protein
VGFPPHLLDELARVYARAAVDAFLIREDDVSRGDTASEEGSSAQEEGSNGVPDAVG